MDDLWGARVTDYEEEHKPNKMTGQDRGETP